MMLGARTGAWSKSGGGEWKNPYITDGLVAMWDGEWNAGEGIHDSSSNVLVNLGSAGESMNASLNTQFTSTPPEIGSNYIQFFRHGNYFVTPNGFFMLIEKGNFTFEFVWLRDNDSLNNYQGVLGNHYLTGKTTLGPVFFQYENGIGGIGSWKPSTTFCPNNVFNEGVNIKQHCSFGSSSSTLKCLTFKNGDMIHSCNLYSLSQVMFTNPYGLAIGSALDYPTISSQDRTLSGRIYTVRVYSRQLSDSEISSNYAVDKARFNLS